MKRHISMLVVVLSSFFLFACDGGRVALDEDANKMAEEYIEAVTARDYEKALSMVSPDFFSIRTKETWIEYFNAVNETMGPVISIKLSKKHEDDRFSGRFYMYQFSIKHENGFTKELVTFIEKIHSDAPLQVLAHKIESSKLMKVNQMY